MPIHRRRFFWVIFLFPFMSYAGIFVLTRPLLSVPPKISVDPSEAFAFLIVMVAAYWLSFGLSVVLGLAGIVFTIQAKIQNQPLGPTIVATLIGGSVFLLTIINYYYSWFGIPLLNPIWFFFKA